jgi:hypothetical protein
VIILATGTRRPQSDACLNRHKNEVDDRQATEIRRMHACDERVIFAEAPSTSCSTLPRDLSKENVKGLIDTA